MDKTYYITTPIYYVNAEPHLGHAYTTIVADFLFRWHSLDNYESYFLTGTDEHGEKVYRAAATAKKDTQSFTDEISHRFRMAWEDLNILNSDFIRTTEERHKEVVQHILQQVYNSGDIYLAEYEGLYSVGSERFVTEKELVDGKLPEDAEPPVLRKETNYFFRMEKYQSWLIDYLENNPKFIQPEQYLHEVLGILREPIGNLSISRPKSRVPWGIPLPWDKNHVTYVWFDALLNYISALNYPDSPLFAKFWNEARHLIGKDILKAHAIFWPTMLKAAKIPIYKNLFVGGYLFGHDGRKMSKSIGNVMNPFELSKQFGSDLVRYYLLRTVPYGNDGNVGSEALIQRCNADLSNDLGNLISRTRKLILKYLSGRLEKPQQTEADQNIIILGTKLLQQVRIFVFELKINQALETMLQYVRSLNRYFDNEEPWKLAKDINQFNRLCTVLYNIAEGVRIVSTLMTPAIPSKAQEIQKALGISSSDFSTLDEWGKILPGTTIPQKSDILFPRLEFSSNMNGSSQSLNKRSYEQDSNSESKIEKEKPMEEPYISIDQFSSVKLKVGEVLYAEKVEKTDKLMMIKLQIGDSTRVVVSGIALHYTPENLIGKKLIVVTNLKPVKLRGILSEGMILASENNDGTIALAELPQNFPSGTTVR